MHRQVDGGMFHLTARWRRRMNRIEKALLLGAAGALAYRLIARRRSAPKLDEYFYGKAAVVTGGASGIGRAIVGQLRRFGTAVLAVDRDREALHRLEGEFPGITTLALDLGDED